MKRCNLISLSVAILFIFIGFGTALAGGSSDTSGDGYHCYLFFDLGGDEFAQVMINDSDDFKVEEEVLKAIDKYEEEEGGILETSIGNLKKFALPDGRSVCGECKPSASGCSHDDVHYCGGKLQKCLIGGECVTICNPTYSGGGCRERVCKKCKK